MMLGALFVGAALLTRARGDDPRPRVGTFRWPTLALVVVVGVFSLFALIGNRYVGRTGGSTEALARDRADRADAWAPWSPIGWAQLGDTQRLRGNNAGARTSYRVAIARDPNDYLTWLNLALASSGAARTTAAREALRLNPLSPEINSLRPYLGLPPLPAVKTASAAAPSAPTAPTAPATTTQP